MNKNITNRIIRSGKRVTAAVMAACCIFSLCSCTFSAATESSVKASVARVKADQRIHNKIKEMIGIDINDDYIENAEGLSDFSSGSSLGMLKIAVAFGKENDLINQLEGTFGRFDNISAGSIPVTLQNQYYSELRQMTSIKTTEIKRTLQDGSTATVSIYTAQQGTKTYMYIFG